MKKGQKDVMTIATTDVTPVVTTEAAVTTSPAETPAHIESAFCALVRQRLVLPRAAVKGIKAAPVAKAFDYTGWIERHRDSIPNTTEPIPGLPWVSRQARKIENGLPGLGHAYVIYSCYSHGTRDTSGKRLNPDGRILFAVDQLGNEHIYQSYEALVDAFRDGTMF